MQDYSKAEAQFRACIRLVPDFDQSYLNLANLYLMRSDTGQARNILEELLRIQPSNQAANQALQMLQSPR
jgi:tetratricopeptide (TPR) repeat protein